MSDRCAQQMADLIESGISERDALYQEIDSLKAHAVEVLASELWSNDEYNKYATLEEARSEARALLGWDNENNEKGK